MSNRELTHLILSAEDRVRVKRYDSKENFLPVYDDRIEEDKDEDNYTSNFDTPKRERPKKTTVLVLPGCALDIIMDYFGSSTTMYLLSKGVFRKILSHKIAVHDAQRDILAQKLDNYNDELQYLKARDRFTLSKNLREEYESEPCREDWNKLIEVVKRRQLSPKDMVVLKLYFTFMGVELMNTDTPSTNDDTEAFYEYLNKVFHDYGENLNHYLDPDSCFEFSHINIEKIKELLIGLNQDKFMNSEVSQL